MEELDFPLLRPDEAREVDREESLLREAEERTLRRVTVRLGILAALLALLTGAGCYLLWAQLESARQASRGRPVAEPAEREAVQRLEAHLEEVQEQVAKAQARLQELAAETERRLASTERQQGEQAQELNRITEKVEEVSRAQSEQAPDSLERLRADLAGVEQLAGTIGAPLAKKLDILLGLPLDPLDTDVEV